MLPALLTAFAFFRLQAVPQPPEKRPCENSILQQLLAAGEDMPADESDDHEHTPAPD